MTAARSNEPRKPKFCVGQIVAETGHGWHYVKIAALSKSSAMVLGYSGEYPMALNRLRPLTKKECGR